MKSHRLVKDQPALVLAPMEGITDSVFRKFACGAAPFTHAVTEFLRISQSVPKARTFFEHIPELKTGCQTATGTPVHLQLLGGDAERLTETALRAAQLGAKSIDMNFGCPAPTVNRHDGGATLLKYPERIRAILSSLRKSLPADVSVSAKMRLGFSDPKDIYRNAEMAFEAGVDWLTIHARTRDQGYRPPVDWKIIGDIAKDSPVPIVANGDIASREDFLRCLDLTGCLHYMIGRGFFVNPALISEIARELQISKTESFEFSKELRPIFVEECRKSGYSEIKTLHRLKQWSSLRRYKAGQEEFDAIKLARTTDEFLMLLSNRPSRSGASVDASCRQALSSQ